MTTVLPGLPSTIAADPVGLLVAFGAGMLSFLSPCVLPLVPGYVSMVSGLSATDIESGGSRNLGVVVRGLLLFVAGFTVVFTLLGAVASGVGRLLLTHQRQIDVVSGAVVIVFGLWLLGIATPARFLRERRFHPRPSRLGAWAPPILGMAFAFGWTPCIGPVLGGVLGLAEVRATLASGVALLVTYSLGLGVPFLVTGIAFGRITTLLARVRRRLFVVDLVSGVALVVFGALLLTDSLHWVSSAAAAVLRTLGLGRLTVS
ncbi:MAG TPA: cytochrome c biogenesis protein CcdA [Acidimicrobiales bacterium]|nr:cytochrome c biogenesis protein CcdA [Acidimicrobiales bacterium]HUI02456.1 cytochrome c biogenesis protein CcdA [Acidimicrobiales bacterium]